MAQVLIRPRAMSTPIRTLILASALAACASDPTSAPPAPGKGDGASCTPVSGDIDACFGQSGFATVTGITQVLFATSTPQPDGKVVLYGHTSTGPFVQRLLVDGAADPTFQVALPDATFMPGAVAIAPDGRIIVAGTSGSAPYGALTMLYLEADGSADPARTSATIAIPNQSSAIGERILLDDDGGFLVLGTSKCQVSGACDTSSVFVARFDATGKLDPSYGSAGVALIASGPHTMLKDVVRQSGALTVLGLDADPIYIDLQPAMFDRVVVASIDGSGQPVSGFGTSGVTTWYDPADTTVGTPGEALRVAGDGTVAVVAGTLTDSLVTFGSDGHLASKKPFYTEVLGFLDARFALDGSIFGVVNTYPWQSFVHFAADGSADPAFQTGNVTVPGVPADASSLQSEITEAADAWIVTSQVYLPQMNPEDELVLFRIWK